MTEQEIIDQWLLTKISNRSFARAFREDIEAGDVEFDLSPEGGLMARVDFDDNSFATKYSIDSMVDFSIEVANLDPDEGVDECRSLAEVLRKNARKLEAAAKSIEEDK